MSTTFGVSDVKATKETLSEAVGAGMPITEAVKKQLKSKGVPEAGKANLEAVVATGLHGFLHAVHVAFDKHMPLVLSPDDVWLTIAQGCAAHINANAEKLRKQFVAHEDKVYIEIRRDEFRKGSPDNDWAGGFGEFSDKIAEHIGKKRDLLVSSFSTTDFTSKASSEVVLMDAMSNYFSYGCRTCCGFPEITLLGELDDWKSIRRRTEALAEFDLSWWTGALLPVLDEFIAAHQGRTNKDFWKSFYKRGGGSGGPYVTGAINTLFPYLEGGRQNRYVTRWDKGVGNMCGGPNPDDFAIGLSKVPFTWHYFGSELPMEFIGGFVGLGRHPDSDAIRPAIGWAVRDAEITPIAY